MVFATSARWACLVIPLVAASCGRIHYDAGCPEGTTELSPGASVCIEQVERGVVPWTDAVDDCESLGRRLCADLEWYDACVHAVGMVDMTDGGYEWVAEEEGGVALKRGSTSCEVMSSHAVVDPYEYRCCLDL